MNMIERFSPNARMSMATKGAGLIFVSGQVAEDRKASLDAQTRSVLGLIDRHLAAAGSDKTHLLFVQVYLPNIIDFDAMNAVYDAWLPAGAAPARACVEARLADPDLRIEISAIAAA